MTKRYTIDTIHLILKTTIVAAGFFDENWQLKK